MMDAGYTWEAERADGSVITNGDDLAGCVRFSLRPANEKLAPLPGHDLVGVSMRRRFTRCFNRVRFGGPKTVPGLFFWTDGSAVLKCDTDCTGRIAPGMLIGKGVAGEGWYPVAEVNRAYIRLALPYSGPTKIRGMKAEVIDPAMIKAGNDRLHIVICEGFRANYRESDGACLITPQNYELYL